jgi:Ser/Thr protein kinase RdoA (MazF antagonist)
MFNDILTAYDLDPADCDIYRLESGLINYTWKVTIQDKEYILQQINTQVFKNPYNIAENLETLNQYITRIAPGYLFVAPLLSVEGNSIVKNQAGDYFRMFPFVKNSHTVNTISNIGEAYEAAKQFGTFARLFNGLDLSLLNYTLVDFHNLTLRIDQFRQAVKQATPELLKTAREEIIEIEQHADISSTYEKLVNNSLIPLRVTHHDTKVSNVLFDDKDKGLCVIDLDTVMPGYYISDVGDMFRTYLSPANEEEKDFSKIVARPDVFYAIYKGYMEQMEGILTPVEKENFVFSGKFMIYMQAVRFLTDYLNNDIYYQVKYPGHNLVRAKNQLYFLDQYIKAEPLFAGLMQLQYSSI